MVHNGAQVVTSILQVMAAEILGSVASTARWTPVNGNLGAGCLVIFPSQDAAQTFVNAIDSDGRFIARMRDGAGKAEAYWVGGSR